MFVLMKIFCHQFYTFSALGRSDATFGKHYRLLENDSTDAISFNSAISACEKHLAKGSIGTVSRCRGPEDLDLERLLYAFISPPKHLFFLRTLHLFDSQMFLGPSLGCLLDAFVWVL